MLTAILMIILFVFLIFPHELGHFIAAKANGVKVNEFAFGMGPAIYQKQGKETLYSIRAIPVGGYCSMEGEDTEEAGDDPRAFNNKAWWQKIIILLAGAAMNVFIAFLALTLVAGIGGSVTTTLGDVTEGGPAAEAGLIPGDKILAVNSQATPEWYDVISVLDEAMAGGKEVAITVKRGRAEETFQMTPKLNSDGEYKIGIEAKVSHNAFLAIKNGAVGTKDLIGALYGALVGLFKTENALEQVSGPIGMVQVVSETRNFGGLYYLYLLAVISLNLAVFNLLPLPALDGGRIIFVFIRMITGEAISDSVEGKVHAIGLAVLLALAAIVAGNDILKLIGH